MSLDQYSGVGAEQAHQTLNEHSIFKRNNVDKVTSWFWDASWRNVNRKSRTSSMAPSNKFLTWYSLSIIDQTKRRRPDRPRETFFPPVRFCFATRTKLCSEERWKDLQDLDLRIRLGLALRWFRHEMVRLGHLQPERRNVYCALLGFADSDSSEPARLVDVRNGRSSASTVKNGDEGRIAALRRKRLVECVLHHQEEVRPLLQIDPKLRRYQP